MGDQPAYTCIVTGANGYLGSHMVHFLEMYGHNVIACDVGEESAFGIRNYLSLDVTCREDFEQLPVHFDYLFSFAGLTGTHASFEQYRQYIAVNELGLLHMLDHVRGMPHLPRIVFPSTRLVYKGLSNPLAEEDIKEARTVYAATKIAAEHHLQAYSHRYGIPFSVFRICIPYANKLNDQYPFGTVGFFLKMAREGQDITLYGDGRVWRTFTHIEDLCRQIIIVSMAPESACHVYNVAGEDYTLMEAAGMVAARFGVTVKNTPWPDKDLRIESGGTCFDSSKIRQMVKDPVQLKLEDWIRDLQ